MWDCEEVHKKMTLKRLWNMIRISMMKNGFQRAAYMKKKNIFAQQGEHCFWQPRNIPPEAKLIKLHDNVVVASEVLFINHDVIHHVFRNIDSDYEFPTKYGAIEIGNNVFIGSRCIILPDAKIEDNVIIGAGSLVRGKLQRGGGYAGMPAKRIGDFEQVMWERKVLIRDGKPRAEYFEEFWIKFNQKYDKTDT